MALCQGICHWPHGDWRTRNYCTMIKQRKGSGMGGILAYSSRLVRVRDNAITSATLLMVLNSFEESKPEAGHGASLARGHGSQGQDQYQRIDSVLDPPPTHKGLLL